MGKFAPDIQLPRAGRVVEVFITAGREVTEVAPILVLERTWIGVPSRS